MKTGLLRNSPRKSWIGNELVIQVGAIVCSRASFLRFILASSLAKTSGLNASLYLIMCHRMRGSLCAPSLAFHLLYKSPK